MSREKKYPYYISLKNDEVFVFGGIWSSWTDKETGEIVNTYSVITVEANEFVSHIHNTKKRMPLILDPEDALKWIDASIAKEEIKSLIKPFESDKMKAHTVQKFIPANPNDSDSKEVIAYYYYPELVDLFDNNK